MKIRDLIVPTWRKLRDAAIGAIVGAALVAVPVAIGDQSSLFSPTTGTVSGLNLTNNYNSALNALASCNSGASAPANTLTGSPVGGMCWFNTSTGVVSVYDGANWLPRGSIDAASHIWRPIAGGGEDTVASASTANLCGASGATPGTTLINISGTTTITAFGSNCPLGAVKVVFFAGTLTLTNSASLLLPGAANIVTASGDSAMATYFGSNIWVVNFYNRANGQPVIHGLVNVQQFGVSGTYTKTNGANSCIVEVQAAGGGSGGAAATSTNQFAMGGSGAGGSYIKVYYASCATISGDTVTIGAVGTAGTAGGAGGTATSTTFGAHVTCPGGTGGAGGAAAGSTSAALAILGATQPAACTQSGGLIVIASVKGGTGAPGFSFTNNNAVSGIGGDGFLGKGAAGQGCNTGGTTGNNNGGGAGGSLACASIGGGEVGALGGSAIANVYEYN